MLMQLIALLSWLALPVGLIVIADDWFIRSDAGRSRPHRRPPVDPPLMKAAYMLLPLFILAAVVRLLVAERLDFSAVLFGITAVTGVAWLLDVALPAPAARQAAQAAGKDPAHDTRAGHGRLRPQLLPGGGWSCWCCAPSYSSLSGFHRIR